MAQYIETATDLNVEGVEFFVKDTPDGFIYEDAEFNKKVDTKTLKHAFEMNDIVIIDNGIACRASNLEVKTDYVVITYLLPSVDNNVVSVTPKQVRSFDKILITDVNVAADEDLFGKVISDLQENVVIGDNDIRGTLKYVTGYTGFSSKVEEQSGHYLVIHNETNGDEPIFVEIIGGSSGPRQLDSDGIIVLRIANKEQRVKVTSGSATKEYSLANIFLADESAIQTEPVETNEPPYSEEDDDEPVESTVPPSSNVTPGDDSHPTDPTPSGGSDQYNGVYVPNEEDEVEPPSGNN